MEETWLPKKGLMMACYAGSHLYGTTTEHSDIDIRGVCLPPESALIGLDSFEQFQPKTIAAREWSGAHLGVESDDLAIYSLGKFLRLALDSNPNIVELLYAPHDAMLFHSKWWAQVLEKRSLLVSQRVVHTFAGYATGQLVRIRRHKDWLDHPPEQPDPADFGIVIREGGQHDWTDRNQYNAYQSRLKNWQNYTKWRTNRNPARAELERKFGYDTKHAAHLYRLVMEANELLKTGHLTLPLDDDRRRLFMDVLGGKFSYESVVNFGSAEVEGLARFVEGSPLPAHPDRKAINAFLIETHYRWLVYGVLERMEVEIQKLT